MRLLTCKLSFFLPLHGQAGCGLTSWFDRNTHTANSDIVHATAQTADGPYHLTGSVLGAFAHNPAPVRLVSGELAIAHIGCGDGSVPLKTTCTNGTTPTTHGHPEAHLLDRADALQQWGSHCNSPGWTGLLMSGSASGPWSQAHNRSGPGFRVDGGPDAWHHPTGLTNPSLWPLHSTTEGVPAGSVLFAFSTSCPNCTLNPNHKHIGIALGEPIAGAQGHYALHDLTPTAPIFPWATEDPCVWRDPDSGYFHILAHRTGASTSHTHTYMHPYTHIPMHPYTHTGTHIHAYTHTLIQTYTYTYTYTHTHIHPYTRAYVHTYTHTYTHTHIHIHAYTHTHTRTRTYTHTHMNTCIHAYTYTCPCTHNHYTYTPIHPYTYTHTRIHTCTHAPNTHTHIHTYTYTHTHIHPYTHTQNIHTTPMYTHIHRHTDTHTHTHTPTLTR